MRVAALLLYTASAVLLQDAKAHSMTRLDYRDVNPAFAPLVYGPAFQPNAVPQFWKRGVPGVAQDGTGFFGKTLTAVRSTSQQIKDKVEQARELLVPALRHHLEAIARAEVPRPIKSWRLFTDGGTVRETIRKSNTAFVRAMDKVRQPSQEYRYMRKTWRYEPDLRKHYFFPRILRIPIIWQESELPYDKEVENFTKGNDDEFGHRSLVLAHLPLYANLFAEKPEKVVVPLDLKSGVHSSDTHGPTADVLDASRLEQAKSPVDTSSKHSTEQQRSVRAALASEPATLHPNRPSAEKSIGFSGGLTSDGTPDHSLHAQWQDAAGAHRPEAAAEGLARSATHAIVTPRHTAHGSGIFFPDEGEIDFAHTNAATSNMQPPLQDLSQSDVSTELEKPSELPSQKRVAKGIDAMEVALNFHNTLMDMRHRYNGFLDYQRSQIHKASLRYPGHPEYEPELDPNLESFREGAHNHPVDALGQRIGGDEAASIVSSKSQPVSPYGNLAGQNVWTQHHNEATKYSSGINSPTPFASASGSGRANRYPAHYSDYLYAAYREISPNSSPSRAHKLDQNEIPLARPLAGSSPLQAKLSSRIDVGNAAPPAPPSSPQRWEDQQESSRFETSRWHPSDTSVDSQDDLSSSPDGSASKEIDKKGYRRFSSRLEPVEIPIPREHLHRTVSFFLPKDSEEGSSSLQRQNTDGRLSRASSGASFAFRSSGSLADHPTPRMPPSSRHLPKEGSTHRKDILDRQGSPNTPVFERIHGEESDDSRDERHVSHHSGSDASEAEGSTTFKL